MCQASSGDYSKKGKVFVEMLNECLNQIRAPSCEQRTFMRCDVNFDISLQGRNLNTFIGRAAHIEFLETDIFARFIMWSFPELFRWWNFAFVYCLCSCFHSPSMLHPFHPKDNKILVKNSCYFVICYTSDPISFRFRCGMVMESTWFQRAVHGIKVGRCINIRWLCISWLEVGSVRKYWILILGS